jgi:tetratricopeptide (TPR) repeat protein
MIVKNESRVIERLMKSVLPLIDSYCICDTGSTDNTVELIEAFFLANNIPGRIVREPFKDFGHNRTFALNSCIGLPNSDYLLLVDADMTLRIDPKLDVTQFKNSLTKDAYYVLQGTETFYYKNVRILRNDPEYSYWGVTHEYVKTTNGSVYAEIEKDKIFIDDIGDGGAKADKFERDIRLLTKGLEENPNNERYTFYLANSYSNTNQYEKAIEYYKKRIELGGWQQEVWFSYYSIGKCYKCMNDIANALYYWTEGYQYFPKRIENLYQIVNYYRIAGKNTLSYAFYEMADYERTVDPSTDHLFLEKDIYDFKLDYEFTIIAYYRNTGNRDVLKSCMKVLAHPNADDGTNRNILSNYKFYTKRLKDFETKGYESRLNVLKKIGNDISIDRNEFISSTPSICIDQYSPNKLHVNLRYVNYRIDDKGNYVNKENIRTKNVVASVDIGYSEWKIEKTFELGYDDKYDNLYVGIEDVRIFSNNGEILYNANRGLDYHNVVIETGKINMKSQRTNSNVLEVDNQRPVEKNWVMFKNGHREIKTIYGWHPLVIGTVNEHPDKKIDDKNNIVYKLQITDWKKTPNFFKWVRGSTNGVVVDNEIWFICHLVSYEDRRYYYHIFVVLDLYTMEVKRYSKLFTFEKRKVEYTLGFVYFEKEKQFLVGYSLMDSETKYMMIGKDKVESEFF